MQAYTTVITQLGHTKSKQHDYVTRPDQSRRLGSTGVLICSGNIRLRSQICTRDRTIYCWCLSTAVSARTQRDTSHLCIPRAEGKDKREADSSAHACRDPLFSSGAKKVSRLSPTHNSGVGATTPLSFKVSRLLLCSTCVINTHHMKKEAEIRSKTEQHSWESLFWYANRGKISYLQKYQCGCISY